MLAYVDTPQPSDNVIPHAAAMAKALGAPLTLFHVLDIPHNAITPPDPVAWSVRRREAHQHLARIAERQAMKDGQVDVTIAEGQPAEQILRWIRDHESTLTVISANGDGNNGKWGLADTARRLVERGSGDLLLVPPHTPGISSVRYRRLLVPLDGSYRAESILPLVMRLARAMEAELVLAHIIPVAELTETGPLEAEDHRLREKLAQRNERVAREYLERIRSRIAQSGLKARSMIVRNGDVRSSLTKLAADEHVDLLVMSSHGRSGRTDCACGSVASYMVSHVETPLLIAMRSSTPNRSGSSSHTDSRARLPSRSM